MRRGQVLASLVATGLITAGSMASTSAGAGTVRRAAKPAGVVSHTISKSAQAAALRYWTPARMRAAKSLDVLTATEAPTTSKRLNTPHGTPHSIPGHAPDGTTLAGAVPQGAHPAAFTYPFPFTRFTVSPYKMTKKYPRSVNGKVFFTQNATSFVCSGTSVATTTGRRVWTAGHCLSDGAGVFDSDITFVPAYNGNVSNVAPRGTWAGMNMVTTSAWHNTADLTMDFGAFDVADLKGKTLSQTVGNAGFAWNQSADEQFVAFGYPQAAAFDGTEMIVCLGASAVRDSGVAGVAAQDPIGIGCDMTGGASGGSWNIGWSDSSPGQINGHNDYKYPAQPLALYSPYFDDAANVIRCAGQGTGFGCP